MKKLLAILFLFSVFSSLAQDPLFHVDGSVKNGTLGKPEAGVTVALFQNGVSIFQVMTSSNGKYDLIAPVDLSKPFDVVFKKDGFYSKKIAIDVSKINTEDFPAGDYRPWTNTPIDLISKTVAADLSFLENEPVIKIGNGISPELNTVYQSKMKAKIEKYLIDADKLKAENEAKYQAAIKEGESLYLVQKKYEEALSKYEEALSYKPKEELPIQRIGELDALIAAQKEADLAVNQADSEYLNLIKAAETLRNQKKYDQAIAKYEEALEKKDEQGPKDQIEIIKGLKKEAENQVKYQEAIAAADIFYNQKSYLAAKEKYNIAHTLKPLEQHPITRLAEIEKNLGALNAAQEKKKKYDEAVEAADALFVSEKLEEAKAKYSEALIFESSATYPSDKIKECNDKLLLIAKEKEKAEKIGKLLIDGGVLFTGAKWNEAKLKYNEVLLLDPTNAEAKLKIDDITKEIANQADKAAQEAKFTKLVAEGDLALKVVKYADAKAKYEEALLIKADASAQTKLDNVIKKIKELEDKEALEVKFQELKAEGLKLATEQQWVDAKSKLNEALLLKQDAVIIAKLKEVENKIAANESLVKLEKEYLDLITAAEGKEIANDIDGAIGKYKEASLKKPTEQKPKDKIAELEALKLNNLKQKEIDAKYDVVMKKGKDLMAQQKYLDAIKEFNSANSIKPEEKDPVDLAAEAERLEKAKGNEENEKIEKIFTVALAKFEEKDYLKSKELAERFLSFRPEDQRAKDLIKNINDLELAKKNYALKMQEAEQLAISKNYTKAIILFEQAKVIKNDETKPQERIDELNKIIADQSSQAEKDELYKDYMTKGGLSQTAKSYEMALSHFQNALSVKENDQIAKDKIAEIQQILDDIANANSNELIRKNQFDALIVEADATFNAEDFIASKSTYEKAFELDKSSTYAKAQIDESIKRQRLKDLSLGDAEYEKIIKTGDEMFDIKSYDKARESYNNALSLRPNDAYPKNKLDEINALLNPVISKSAALEDLGDPYDNSIMDGYAALVKADLERKNLKNDGIKRQINNIQNSENEVSQIKVIEQQITTYKLNEVLNTIGLNEDGFELERKLTTDAIIYYQSEISKIDAENETFEHSENLKYQENINEIVEYSALDYNVREAVQSENADILTTYSTNYAEELRVRNEAEANSSLLVDKGLTQIQEYIQEENEGDFEERKITENAVKSIVNTAADMEVSISQEKILENLKSKTQIEKNEILVEEKAINDSRLVPENVVYIEEIEDQIVSAQVIRTEKQNLNSVDINETVDNINIAVSAENAVRDLDRQNTTDQLHEGNKSLEQAAIEAYNKETVKYLQNRAVINSEVIKNSGVEEKANESVAINVKSVDLLDQKANVVNDGIALSDDEERLKARSSVEMISANAEESSNGSTKKQERNSAVLTDMNRTMEANSTNNDQKQIDKHNDTQSKLNNIDSEQPSKVKIANSLGQDYPEGVSQESFTQSDENGLMTAIITRRIVVIQGQGNVYVRTQTMDAITYSKNGEPTTEYTWQKQTTGPNLVKHY